jgi:hypothetical protein
MTRLQPDGVVSSAGNALTVATSRGHLTVLDPAAYAARFGEATVGDETPHFAAYRVIVQDLAAAEAALREGGVGHRRSAGRLLVPASENFGVALELAATPSR